MSEGVSTQVGAQSKREIDTLQSRFFRPRTIANLQSHQAKEAPTRASQLRHAYYELLNKNNKDKVYVSLDGSRKLKIGFDLVGNKHLYSDTFKRCKNIRKRDLKQIKEILSNATYKISSLNYKERNDKIKAFHYFQTTVRGKTVYLQVAEERYSNGKAKKRYLYAISDTLDTLREDKIYRL